MFKEQNRIPFLILYNGETINGKGNNITNFKFTKSEFPLNDVETNTTTYKKTQELNTFKLLKCINIVKKSII